MDTAIVLGAGFSFVAGLPLARDLLDSSVYVASRSADRRFGAVWRSWENFLGSHPDHGPEQFLTELYRQLPNSGVPWEWAVELVAATLATPRGRDVRVVRNVRYSGRITKPLQVPEHTAFWDTVLTGTRVRAVVTTNYDLLAERGLRHRPLKRKPRPGLFYGGLPQPQRLKGLAQPWTVLKPERIVTLEGTVPLFKLHGSLNWAKERGRLVMYQDMRAAFRFGSDAMIIPPLAEKETPKWLLAIWNAAESALASCRCWIVCGYSLPSYDIALRQFFRRAAQGSDPQTVYILDPQAAALKPLWEDIAPGADLVCLPGLPAGLPELQSRLLEGPA